MPIDPEPVDGGNLRLTNQYGRTWVQVVNPGDGTHQPHWTTCPQAPEWRHRHAGHGPETEGQR